MKKNVGLGLMAASVLAVGVAHAGIGIRIEDERERRRKAFLDNECSATGQGHSFGPHGPDGEIQCQYCGAESKMANADFSEIEARSLAHYGNPADILADLSGQPVNEELALYCAQDVQMTTEDFKAAMKPQAPGPDEPLPDRFSVNPENPAYDERWAQVRIGVRFDGRDRPGDVEEYCVSGGWIRIQTFLKNGKVRRERGKIICIKLHGVVEPYRK
jgi:hypothetical protein